MPQPKQPYTITVDIQQAGVGGYLEVHTLTVYATSRGRAEAQARRQALAGRTEPYYAYARLMAQTERAACATV